ncbi:MAG: hypothetical protein IT426_16215 [Pirellulales bacterium]|nr:hypothetical protein [Pirellulales bacterium]
MKPNPRFLKLPKTFWANVRSIGEQAGYTERGKGIIKIPSLPEMISALKKFNLHGDHLADKNGNPTPLGDDLTAYFEYRAEILNGFVEPRLMDVRRAKSEFKKLKCAHRTSCPLPLNKQTGDKKAEAYLTCIINLIISANSGGHPCDYDPRALTTVTRKGAPLRTLARRVDGAFPSTVNPVAVWEIKEYYYTTTFGSRVADGVYETLLDGMELEELREHENIHIKHYLFVDAHYTWWECGKSYLCRIIDMLHMGYVDEVLFGYEVIEQLPRIVREWVAMSKKESSNLHGDARVG